MPSSFPRLDAILSGSPRRSQLLDRSHLLANLAYCPLGFWYGIRLKVDNNSQSSLG